MDSELPESVTADGMMDEGNDAHCPLALVQLAWDSGTPNPVVQPEIETVVKNIGRSGIGNTPQKVYNCDRSHGFRVTGHNRRPCTQVRSQPL